MIVKLVNRRSAQLYIAIVADRDEKGIMEKEVTEPSVAKSELIRNSLTCGPRTHLLRSIFQGKDRKAELGLLACRFSTPGRLVLIGSSAGWF